MTKLGPIVVVLALALFVCGCATSAAKKGVRPRLGATWGSNRGAYGRHFTYNVSITMPRGVAESEALRIQRNVRSVLYQIERYTAVTTILSEPPPHEVVISIADDGKRQHTKYVGQKSYVTLTLMDVLRPQSNYILVHELIHAVYQSACRSKLLDEEAEGWAIYFQYQMLLSSHPDLVYRYFLEEYNVSDDELHLVKSDIQNATKIEMKGSDRWYALCALSLLSRNLHTMRDMLVMGGVIDGSL